jgi:hypothetical protein
MTYEDLQRVNQTIKTIDIKGKNYAQVPERIKAFRMLYPEGFIRNELISNEDGVCIFKSEVGFYTESGEKRVLGVGTAFERQDSTFINKTSYIENCETSACGRALGMAGFGIDTSVASAEEVQNAITNQEKNELITEKEQTVLRKTVEAMGYKVEDFFKKPLDQLTADEYAKACRKLDELKEKTKKK